LLRARIRTALAILTLCVSAFPQSSPQSTPQLTLERAVTLTREKHYSESSAILQAVPEPVEIRQRIAFHRLKAANASGLGDPATAVREISLALSLAPSDPGLLVATAMAEFQADRLDNALRHAAQAGNDPTAKAVIGDVQEKRGNFAEASNAYREAVRLAPSQEQYRVALAYDLIRHQDFRAAVELLQQSKPLFPRSAKLRTLLGIAQYSNGDTDEAVPSLIDAIAVDPSAESAYRCLAQILLQSSAAAPPAATERLCKWNPTVCSALKLRLARQTDDAAMQNEAIAGLQRAASDDPIARCELARAFEWTDRLPDARAEMEACVQFDPSPQNHYRMGLIYKRLGMNDLSQREMDLRGQMLGKMSEETALGLSALKILR
jgi:Flp pilus assembly protein TadD